MSLNKKITGGFFLFIGILFLIAGSNAYLFDQDEAAYAGFAAQMLETGNWIKPEFIYSDLHVKPPLHFWLIAISYKLFGQSEIATRIPSVLAAFGTLLLVWYWGRAFFGKDAAQSATIILASNFLLIFYGKIAFTDSLLLFFQTGAALAFYRVIKGDKNFVVAFWFMVAGALLTKGPPVVIHVGGLAALWLIFSPQRHKIWKTHPWFGLPLALAPLLIWGYFLWQEDGGKTVNWLIDHYVLRRVSASGSQLHNWTGYPGYHLGFMLVAFLPFLFLIPLAFRRIIHGVRLKSSPHLFLLLWLVSAWVVFEIVRSKLPSYALAAHPALAIMMGALLEDLKKGRYSIKWNWIRVPLIIQLVLIFGLTFAMVVFGFQFFGPPGARWGALGGILFWVGSVLGMSALLANRTKHVQWFFAISALMFQMCIWNGFLPLTENSRAIGKHLHRAIKEENPYTKDVMLFLSPSYANPSVPLYLDKYYDDVFRAKDMGSFLERARSISDPHIIISAGGFIEEHLMKWMNPEQEGYTLKKVLIPEIGSEKQHEYFIFFPPVR